MANVYRADQVGSLIPPAPLPPSAGSAAEQPAVVQAIQSLLSLQKECGIDIASDGELLRSSACSLFADDIGIRSDSDGNAKSRVYVAGALARHARLTAREVAILKRVATAPFKITLPSPTAAALALYREGVSEAHYLTRRDLAQALAAILRQEIADLITEGVPYIQLNGPAYEVAAERAGAARFASVDEMLRIDAQALRDLHAPEKITLALHLPRARDGTGALLQDAGLGEKRAAMLESAVTHVPANRFLIELPADAAASDFAPLRAVPKGRMAVLGLVDPLAPRADDVDPLLERLDLAVTFLDAERLALSPRQGFATPGAARERQAFEAQRRSLTLTVETARRFWGFEM